MTKTIYFNGEFVPEEKALIPVTTHALHYGTGVFEGIRAYYNDSKHALFIFRLKEHFERMKRNTSILSIKLPLDIDELCKITQELVKQNFAKADLYIRPLAYKKDRAVGNFTLTKVSDGFFMYVVPLGKHFQKEGGISVMISSWERVSDKAIPPRGKITGAYVNTCLAKTESVEKGFDEAIFMNNQGHISEASSENIFVVKNNIIVTPPLTDDILEGITRNTVMVLLKEELGLQTVEQSITLTEFYEADEVFLTGTGAEINPVTSIDGKLIREGKVGPISQKVQEIYNKLVHGEFGKHDEWLTIVKE